MTIWAGTVQVVAACRPTRSKTYHAHVARAWTSRSWKSAARSATSKAAPFLEAIRQFPYDVGRDNVLYVHLTLVRISAPQAS